MHVKAENVQWMSYQTLRTACYANQIENHFNPNPKTISAKKMKLIEREIGFEFRTL